MNFLTLSLSLLSFFILKECNDLPCDKGSARHVLDYQTDFSKYDLS